MKEHKKFLKQLELAAKKNSASTPFISSDQILLLRRDYYDSLDEDVIVPLHEIVEYLKDKGIKNKLFVNLNSYVYKEFSERPIEQLEENIPSLMNKLSVVEQSVVFYLAHEKYTDKKMIKTGKPDFMTTKTISKLLRSDTKKTNVHLKRLFDKGWVEVEPLNQGSFSYKINSPLFVQAFNNRYYIRRNKND